MSCLDDTYELTVGNKCLKKSRIQIVTKLDISYDEYWTVATKVREDFSSFLGDNYINRTEYVLLRNIKRGSVILDVLLAVPEN